MPSINSSLWDFALELYETEEVRNACLTLQDESGVDVLMLLFSLWLAWRSVGLSHDELPRIDGCIAEWRSRVVHPLREVRRYLKQHRPREFGDEAESLRQQTMALELASERLELEVLESEGVNLSPKRDEARNPALENADNVVRFYRKNQLDARSTAALGQILAAFMRLPSGDSPE